MSARRPSTVTGPGRRRSGRRRHGVSPGGFGRGPSARTGPIGGQRPGGRHLAVTDPCPLVLLLGFLVAWMGCPRCEGAHSRAHHGGGQGRAPGSLSPAPPTLAAAMGERWRARRQRPPWSRPGHDHDQEACRLAAPAVVGLSPGPGHPIRCEERRGSGPAHTHVRKRTRSRRAPGEPACSLAAPQATGARIGRPGSVRLRTRRARRGRSQDPAVPLTPEPRTRGPGTQAPQRSAGSSTRTTNRRRAAATAVLAEDSGARRARTAQRPGLPRLTARRRARRSRARVAGPRRCC
ncbi:hypothetical protein Pla86_38880 [Planctomycetes bacterium Pla86]|uniref:Uncharacterized protein n=1 Tax=Engelhardtia mirabilis TaxID=2528011 RepID=A0A518BPA3_9BACT|nr:hypothetical protein Pla133_38890 [Planctomycetes bacterium Pla133]QDV03113.1 hypothetical protein Pla86_38880 [Planctomycetes bacterium Pla86]